jgi:hypothetical protein
VGRLRTPGRRSEIQRLDDDLRDPVLVWPPWREYSGFR